MPAVEIRRVRADEGSVLRSLRLRALAESPHAFSSTLQEERVLAEPEWAARAAAGAAGAEVVVIVALADGGVPVGMAGGRVRDEPGVVSLWGMWVDPAVRGERVGARLIDAVDGWARAQGAHGATLITADTYFSLPAYPLELVVDPTGAGDTFAGGFVGFIASHAGGTFDDNVLRNAMAYGTSLASYTVQRFGT